MDVLGERPGQGVVGHALQAVTRGGVAEHAHDRGVAEHALDDGAQLDALRGRVSGKELGARVDADGETVVAVEVFQSGRNRPRGPPGISRSGNRPRAS